MGMVVTQFNEVLSITCQRDHVTPILSLTGGKWWCYDSTRVPPLYTWLVCSFPPVTSCCCSSSQQLDHLAYKCNCAVEFVNDYVCLKEFVFVLWRRTHMNTLSVVDWREISSIRRGETDTGQETTNWYRHSCRDQQSETKTGLQNKSPED